MSERAISRRIDAPVAALLRPFVGSRAVRWLGLLGLCSAYLQGGIHKAGDFRAAIAEMQHFGIELVAPLLILTDALRWLGAGVLASSRSRNCRCSARRGTRWTGAIEGVYYLVGNAIRAARHFIGRFRGWPSAASADAAMRRRVDSRSRNRRTAFAGKPPRNIYNGYTVTLDPSARRDLRERASIR
jgi:hypothetical protein